MKTYKGSEEFQVGKHRIGHLYNFDQFDNVEFEERSIPIYHKLSHQMTDEEINRKLNPGLCTLGDVLALLDTEDQEFKDGYSNMFYMKSCVVSVSWFSGACEWSVHAWGCGGRRWIVGSRLLSPATQSSGTSDYLTLESFDTRLRKLENLFNPELI